MELIPVGLVVLFLAFLFAYPGWRRWEIARDRRRNPRTIPVGGLVAPLDEVFHPAAYEANLVWEAEKIIPAPAPDADGSRPDLATGRIRIDIGPGR